MTYQQEQQAIGEIYETIPQISPTDKEVFEMFEAFLKDQEKKEGIIDLPRGFGQ